MAEQMRAFLEAYHSKVSLKQEALKQCNILSDQVQEKIIELVDTETMYKQLQVAFQAETVESKSWRRQSQSLEKQLAE